MSNLDREGEIAAGPLYLWSKKADHWSMRFVPVFTQLCLASHHNVHDIFIYTYRGVCARVCVYRFCVLMDAVLLCYTDETRETLKETIKLFNAVVKPSSDSTLGSTYHAFQVTSVRLRRASLCFASHDVDLTCPFWPSELLYNEHSKAYAMDDHDPR
jgi:hypothetical protein